MGADNTYGETHFNPDGMKCITFDKEAQASIPKDVRKKMDRDREAAQKSKRFCKGYHADVIESMYCHCGDKHLGYDDTLTEKELLQKSGFDITADDSDAEGVSEKSSLTLMAMLGCFPYILLAIFTLIIYICNREFGTKGILICIIVGILLIYALLKSFFKNWNK